MFDFLDDGVHHFGELLVNFVRVVPFHEIRLVTHAFEELLQFVFGNASQEAGIGDFVAVQVQNRQHAAIAGWVEKFVSVPTGGQRAGFGFAIADDAGDDQIGIVERRAVGMAERITKFATFVNAARSFGSDVAGNSAGEAELLEQTLHSFRVLADVRVHLAVGALEIGVGHQRRSAVAGADDVDHVQIVAVDHAVEMHVEHVQPGRGAPVAQQARLDVFAL